MAFLTLANPKPLVMVAGLDYTLKYDLPQNSSRGCTFIATFGSSGLAAVSAINVLIRAVRVKCFGNGVGRKGRSALIARPSLGSTGSNHAVADRDKALVVKNARILSGQAVLITGGSQGVGRAAACRFASAGFHVIMASRNKDSLENAVSLVRTHSRKGCEVVAVTCDITCQDAVESLYATVSERFADVRILICNAGACMSGDFLEHSLQDFEDQLRVNFLGHVATTQAFLPMLLEHAAKKSNGTCQKPTICFVNSWGGRVPLPNMTAYSASKFALQGFVDSLRTEVAPQGVHVATVHPGVVRSDFRQRAQFRGAKGESARKSLNSMLDGASPVSQLAVQSPEEVADAVFKAVHDLENEVVVGAAFNAVVGINGVAKALGVV